jgi:membrane protease YdiL (CAAX protease family)
MKYNWFESANPSSRLFLMLAFMVVSVIFGFILSVLIAMPIFQKGGFQIITMSSDIQNLANINLLKYMQIVQAIAFFLIPAWLMPIFWGEKPVQYHFLQRKPPLTLAIIAICLILSAIPFINYTELINSKMQFPSFMSGIEHWMRESEANAGVLSGNFMKVSTIGGLLVNLFMMAVLPALGEELVFRGVFQRVFTDWFKNYHIGIIASAMLFSAFHMQFYGFIPRMLLGISFGYMLVWSGNMWVPIIAHFVNNTLGVIYFYLFNKGIVSSDLQTVGTSQNAIYIALLSLGISVALLFLFLKYSKNRK